MAKQNCAVCGKELGLMQQVQMADGNYICRDCEKKTIQYFKPLIQTIEDYNENLKQNERGEKLYNAYFHKNRKMLGFCGGKILFDPDTALVCIKGVRGGLFNMQKQYNVFRLADIDKYETASTFHKGFDNSNRSTPCVFLSFRNVSGMNSYFIPAESADVKKITKAFDDAINGTGRKGIAGFVDSRKAAHKKGMAEAAAIAGIVNGMKDIAAGAAEGSASRQGLMGAAAVIGSMDELFYAGREDLIQKADSAIKAILG